MPDIVGKRGVAVQPISPIIHIAFGTIRGNLREMAPDQDLQTGTEQPDTPAAAEAPRPGRRPGRSHRGRGRGRRPRAPRPEQAPSAEPLSAPKLEAPNAEGEVSREPGERAEAPFPSAEPQPTQSAPPSAHPRPVQSASKATIQGAIDQVNEIINSLKESLEQMDEVLELLECFERQGDADEREIESLRRTLRQLQRPRDSGQHSHRGHS